MYIKQCTPYNAVHRTLHNTPYTIYYTLYSTMYITLCNTPLIVHCTLHSTPYNASHHRICVLHRFDKQWHTTHISSCIEAIISCIV